MKIVISNIRSSIDTDLNELKHLAAKKLGIGTNSILNIKIVKESIDARRKPNIRLVHSVLVEVSSNLKLTLNGDIRILEEKESSPIIPGSMKMNGRPIIIGFGPAGMFAALLLAQNGYKPLIIERGESMEKRSNIVDSFWKSKILNTETNVQFGEGGAGTFSDGKLTTRINDTRCEKVLEEFHANGAGEEILYKNKPHIGSDVLKSVVVNIRKTIESLGGEIRFNSKMTSLNIKDNVINGITINQNTQIDSNVVVLAIGHSARDTFEVLLNQGILFTPKPFSIGVRIEHPQELINNSQYGNSTNHLKLGPADYQLFYKTANRTVYSFCMCPGGIVVASSSEPDTIVTNGMSEYKRDRENANSALVVSVDPHDFESTHPLAGMHFQRMWENLAYKAGGSNYTAPVQLLGDFLSNQASKKIGCVQPSYTGDIKPTDLNLCLPDFVTSPMRESIKYFDNKIKGFGMKDAVLTGVETRTSSPVRIERSDSLEAIGFNGLYPAGEGAGYAGGIVSAAVDGLRIAEEIIRKYTPIC